MLQVCYISRHVQIFFLNGKFGMNQLKRLNLKNQTKNKIGLFKTSLSSKIGFDG
jgi:hypothetical protein